MPAPEKSGLTAGPRPLGIIAGSGMLPRALVQKCIRDGVPVAVVALNGFAQVSDFAPHLRTSMSIGRGRAMINFFHQHDVQDIVLIGAVRRPSLWDVRPDWWTLTRLGPLLLRGGLGDDGLLKAVRHIFEHEGFRVQAIQSYLPELIAAPGALGAVQPDDSALYDIKRGFDVARALGSVDVGQSVVVQGGIVLGVEAAEGTTNLIRRCGVLKRAGPGPILVKAAKPGQDTSLDLPTVGPDTITAALEAGFRGVVVHAGHTLIVEPMKMIERADPAEFFIFGYTGGMV